jgi:cytochrome P450
MHVASQSEIVISPYVLHRLPSSWDAPEDFRPERFLADPASWGPFLPFGTGPRACIGTAFGMLEAKCIIAKMVLKYKMELEGGPHKLQQHLFVSLRTAASMVVKLSPR